MSTGAKDTLIIELKDTISQLNATVSALNLAVAALNRQHEEDLQQHAKDAETNRVLQEQIAYLTKKLFGTSSEKMELFPGQINLFDEAEQERTTEPEKETTVSGHTRKVRITNEEKFRGLPVEEKVIELPVDERACPACGTELAVIGREHVRDELEYIPAKVKVISYYRTTYACPNCRDNAEDAVIVKPSVPDVLIPHGFASPSAVAWTMYQKYANGMPLYRQEKDWSQAGFDLSRGTMANWIIYCANEYFKPVYDHLHRELVKRQFLMADETRIQVLKEKDREPETDSFMWLYRSGEDGLPPIILYGYTETRGGFNAKAFLDGFEGYLETDGYQGYSTLPNIKRCCCFAHVRRYFVEAVPKGRELDITVPAVQGLQYINQLFEYERISKAKNHTPEQRKEYRLQKEKPVLEAFFTWLDMQHPVKNSRTYKAVNYSLGRKPYLMTYLEDGRCSFTNNLSENAIRPFTVGRKNWLFSDTPKGAEASATVYTMVEMAKAHGLNIYRYLSYLLENRPDRNMTDEDLSQFVPWSERVQETCKN